MKTILRILIISFSVCIAAGTNAQFNVNITGKNCKGSLLSANAKGGNLTSLEWKLNGEIIATAKCSRKGTTVAGGNGEGDAANQLDDPNGVFVDDEGNLWVADTHNKRIQKFVNGSEYGITIGANLPNAPSSPTNVVVTTDGSVYVADYFASRVKKLAPNGNKWVDVAGQNNEMKLTRGVWVDEDGNVYATDCGNSRVLRYAPGSCIGVVVAGGNGYGSALNQLARPVSVVVDGVKNVYVTEENNQRVTKWLPGALQGVIVAGNYDTSDSLHLLKGKGGVNDPLYGFVSSGKNAKTSSDQSVKIYISDKDSNEVQLWLEGSTTGVTVAGGFGEGDNPFQLNKPFANYVTGNYLFVADRDNARIQRFTLSGNNINTNFIANKAGTYTVTATFSNGSKTESNAIQVTEGCNQSSDASAVSLNKMDANSSAVVFPNPVKNAITVNFQANKTGKYVFELTEAGGKTVLHKEVNAQAGSNSTGMDVSRLLKGMYFLTITDADKTRQTIKLDKE